MLFLIFPSSCGETPITLNSPDPLICSNYEQYEEIGNTLTDFLRFGNNLDDHFDLFPEEFREEFRIDFQNLQLATEGLDFSETLTYLETEGYIGLEYHQSIQELVDFIDTGSFSSPTDFAVKSAEIRDMVEVKKTNGAIHCMEKKSIISFYSMMAGLIDFFEEANTFEAGLGLNQVSTRDCTFFENFKCFFKEFGKAALIGATAGGLIGSSFGTVTLPGIGTVAGWVAGAAIGGILGGAVGILEGINSIQQGPGGPCCPTEWDCKKIVGVQLAFAADCSGSATYRAYGFGSDDVSLGWSNISGMPVTATTLTANATGSPFSNLFITQDSPSTPVTTTITSVCGDPASTLSPSFPIVRNLDQLAKSVKGVQLLGEDQIAPGFDYMYTVFGLTAYLGSNSSPNLSVQWFINGGTITGTNSTSAMVEWPVGFTSGWIQAQVTNTCPGGENKVFTINVTGDGPIP